jgi:hypothetical protein
MAMNEIERICARLIASSPLRRDELHELEHPQIRAEVETRLRSCGLSLATSAYSDHYGLRLLTEVADATVLDAPSNLGLNRDTCALLTVLWARLALQRRTAEDTQEAPTDQFSLLPQDRAERARTFTPSVRFETLAQEFGSRLGGRTRLRSLLGQLRRLGFITYHRLEDIQAGPLLELGIDGEQMIAFIRSRVLGELLSRAQSRSVDSEQGSKQPSQSETPAESVRTGATGAPLPSKRAAGVS